MINGVIFWISYRSLDSLLSKLVDKIDLVKVDVEHIHRILSSWDFLSPEELVVLVEVEMQEDVGQFFKEIHFFIWEVVAYNCVFVLVCDDGGQYEAIHAPFFDILYFILR